MPDRFEKTHSILYAVSVDVIYRCRIIFLYFFVRIKFVTSPKRNTTCELIGFAVSPRWNEAIKVTTALCRVGQQVPVLQHVF